MNQLKRVVLSKAFIIAASVILVYTLAGFFLWPYLIRHYLPKKISAATQKEAALGKVAFNPYLFKLELRAFRMTEPDGRPLLAFERLYVDFELKSLFKWAWLFRDIQLEDPVVHAVIQKEGGLNLAHLGPASNGGPPEDRPPSNGGQPENQTPKQPPRLIFEKIRVAKGKLTFTDRRPSEPATVTVAPLDVGITDLTTLPAEEGRIALTATGGQGETLNWLGQIGLNPVMIQGRISLQNVQSATLAAFAGDRLHLATPVGALAVEADCTIDLGKAPAQILFSNLQLLLNGIVLALPDAPAPFLELPDARISGARLDLTGRKVDLGAIAVHGGSARLAMDDKGVLNLQRLAAPPEKGSEKTGQPAAEQESAQVWRFHLGVFEISGFAAHYEDRRRAPGLEAAIGGLRGRFAAEAQSGEHPTALLKDVMLQLADIRAGSVDAEPAVRIGSVALEKGTADLSRKRLNAALIAIEGGVIQVEKRIDGTLNLAHLFGPPQPDAAAQQPAAADVKQPDAAAAKQDGPSATTPDGATSFQFLVDRMSLSGMQAILWDRTVRGDQPILTIDALSVAASQVDGRSPMPVELSVSIREGGRIKAAGTLDPAGRSLTADIEVAALALATFQPYVAPVAAVVLKTGTFSSAGALRHAIKGTEAQTIYQGEFKVENLQIIETDIDETVLGWKSVHSDELKLLLQPDAVHIGDLRVQDLGGKAIIEKDGSFNLANLIKADAPGSSDSGKGAPKKAERGKKPFFYRIRRVLVNDGRITFADYRLPIPFATRIHELRGTLAGISSVEDARSQLRLRGRVDEFGTARGQGEVNTFDPKKFTHIELAFQNIEMSSLTPYSGRFAGRAINAGKLSVDLSYEVKNGRLAGDNRIVVEQLQLGEKVESPDAVDLPLDLAVALLKNSKGVINLGLPVKGDLNNPQFSFGALVGKALISLLRKVATSPFRAIAALIPGGGEETLDSVAFEPGRAVVPPPEKEKLLKLAEAMNQRPQLKLMIQGRYHPEKDRRALARRSLRTAVTVRLGQVPDTDEVPGPLDFSSSETREVLEEMFSERFGDDALEAFEDEAKKARKEGKAADAGFVAKGLFERLLEVQPMPDARLVELARARAQAVIAEMGRAQETSAERLGTQEPAALKPDEPITAALSLEARQ